MESSCVPPPELHAEPASRTSEAVAAETPSQRPHSHRHTAPDKPYKPRQRDEGWSLAKQAALAGAELIQALQDIGYDK